MSQERPGRTGAFSDLLADRYRVERELGAGGMATVYLAEDLKHHRKVAIKVLHAELSAVLGSERFLKEIELTANLQHPHILPLFDSGSADGLLYYVMPAVDGESLRDRLTREKQLPIADALRIATEVADALAYAHERGVVHRDIKPENILLQGGHCLVADFGIALAVQQAGGTRMTQTGLSLGTPQYMSPEQATGEREIGPRSDLYSLGAVTYEMFTGEPPFTGPTAQAIVAKVMTSVPVAPRELRKTIPPAAEQAVLTALEKLPADRFATAGDFARALTDERAMTPTGARRTARPTTGFWRRLTIACFIAIAGLTGLLIRATRSPRTAPSPWRVMLAFPDSAWPLGQLGLSPDGNSIVYEAGGEHGVQLWVRDANDLAPVPIPGSNIGSEWPTFSPDGQRVAFFAADGSLRLAPRDGRSPVAIVPTGTHVWSAGLAWSGDRLIVATRGGLIAVSLSGGSTQRMTTVDTANGESGHELPDALPGNAGVVFTVLPKDRTNLAAYRIAVSDRPGRHTVLVPGIRARYAPPDQLLVAESDGTLAAVAFDVANHRVTGPAVPLLSAKSVGETFETARTGRLVYFVGEAARAQLVRVARDGSITPIDSTSPSSPTIGDVVAASPDGKSVAGIDAAGPVGEVVVHNLESGSATTISVPGQSVNDPVFSPDGRSVAFTSRPAGSIYRATPGSAAPPQLLSTAGGSDLAFSSDGRRLYYVRDVRGSRRDIFVHSLEPAEPDRPFVATAADEWNPAPSPNGHWLAYLSDESGRSELYVRSTDPSRTQRWMVSRTGATGARWSHDGKELFYTTDFRTGADSMMVATVAPAAEFAVMSRRALFSTAKFYTGVRSSWDVLPSNGTFLMLEFAPTSGRQQLVMVDQWRTLLRGKEAPRG